MSWKHLAADYFTFTRKERIAIFLLIILIILVFLAPHYFARKYNTGSPVKVDTAWSAAVKKLEINGETGKKEVYNAAGEEHPSNWQYDHPGGKYAGRKGELFYFDPNTISRQGWQKLGLRAKTITTIENYLSKGGHFRQPRDLSKVYGLFDDEYARLEPFIRIEKTETGSPASFQAEKTIPLVLKPERYKIIDVNTSDTSAFITLPGIGSRLAARIISFRDKLGGFYAVSQVGETFGLADSVFQKIKQYLKLEASDVKKININTATVDELKSHPYIRWAIANSIIAYRNEHGPFQKTEDIRKVMAVTESIYDKLSPYLTEQ